MKAVLLTAAAILVAVGAIFTLQGVGVLGGSPMTGDRTWAVGGPVLALVGLLLAGWALRRRPGSG